MEPLTARMGLSILVSQAIILLLSVLEEAVGCLVAFVYFKVFSLSEAYTSSKPLGCL
jgi:hypothetical protein